MFNADFSDDFDKQVKGLSKRNKSLSEALEKKIAEIVSRDAESIDFYKNLRAPLNDYKRVRIGSFVLTFRVFKEKNFIRFINFEHHDEAYKKKFNSVLKRNALKGFKAISVFDSFPKKVFHLRKREKAYTYDLKVEIDAHAARFAAKKPSKKQIDAEAKRLRAKLAREGWREAVHPWTGRPFVDIVEEYFVEAVDGLKELKQAA